MKVSVLEQSLIFGRGYTYFSLRWKLFFVFFFVILKAGLRQSLETCVLQLRVSLVNAFTVAYLIFLLSPDVSLQLEDQFIKGS